MRPTLPPTRRRLRPILIAAAFYLAFGSAAAGLVLAPGVLKPVRPDAEPPAAAPGHAAACPAEKSDSGRARLASHAGEGEPEGGSAAGPLNPEDYEEQPLPTDRKLLNYEFEKSASCQRCHAGVEPSHQRPDNAGANCVGCHGGNGERTIRDPKTGRERLRTRAEAHVLPRFPERWLKTPLKPAGKDARPVPEDNDGKPVLHSGNPVRSYTLLNDESPEFIRFVNPGDLRIAHLSCGKCHKDEVLRVRKSMMTHGAFLYGAALYNNGALPLKDAVMGESYSAEGQPQRIQGYFWDPALPGDPRPGGWRLPSPEEQQRYGWLPWLDPLLRWEVSQPGNPFRVFERGGFRKRELDPGNPVREEEAGRPDVKLSFRGYGTLLRTDPTVLGAQKTRLFDPTLNFLGTNDQPGDYRSGGCSACHNVYANDTAFAHSGPYARYGHWGNSFTHDEALSYLSLHDRDGVPPEGDPAREKGHPIRHRMTSGPPTSQCITCHMHPGTNMLTTYLGYTWWDNETDGEHLYPSVPADPRKPDGPRKFVDARRTAPQIDAIQRRNPEGSAAKGLWGDVDFLARTGSKEFNAKLKHSQFADFHGHGWIYRAVYKRDRKGNLLDKDGKRVDFRDPARWQKAVHLQDIHLEKGMHCVDCHFERDSHGTGKLYAEPRAAIEIDCADCHGSVRKKADLILRKEDGTYEINEKAATSGVAGRKRDPTYHDPEDRYWLSELKVPFRQVGGDNDDQPGQGRQYRRFEVTEDGRLFQRSAVLRDKKTGEPLKWEVPQVADQLSPTLPDGRRNPRYNQKAAYAKTMRRDNRTWGGTLPPESELAHSIDKMSCYTCHSSWTTACFGCHLNMQANRRKPQLHNEGGLTRNWTSYNFQTLRDDLYMLGKDGTATGSRTAPVRSSCAVLVSSQNANREWLYYQQQTISAEGLSGTAFSSYVPHTVRGKETKQCTDCHVSAKNDNNAWMANLLLQGSNAVNHFGRYVYVAVEEGFQAVQVTERDEPPAVIGSFLHRLAYPETYEKHLRRGRRLTFRPMPEHPGRTLDLQLRGEYLYAAEGPRGLWVFDVANVDNKGFSERIVTAPVSPLGQKLYVNTRYCTGVAAPSTMTIDGARTQRPENQEQQVHPLYNYLYLSDRYEGLVVVGPVTTLFDGNPANNFLKRATLSLPEGKRGPAWNPGGLLDGANSIRVAGNYAYLTCDRGLVIVDISTPTQPKLAAEIRLRGATSSAVQFRYAFVTDADGLKVLDVTEPEKARLIPGAVVPFSHARDVYVSRTYAYVAAMEQGLAIVDVENPERPRLDRLYTGDDGSGDRLDDVHAVRVGMTNNSSFAYVADGRNGLRVLELTAPDMTPGIHGYSPRPTPRLIATYPTPGPAIAVSEGLDRDRAVDESGNQLSVFGRRGARPFNLAEQRAMYRLDGGRGPLFRVTDEPSTPPAPPAAARASGSGWGWAETGIAAPLGVLFLALYRRRRYLGDAG